MALTKEEESYIENARVARLATADRDGRPNVVPVCFTLGEGSIVISIDEKPKTEEIATLRRIRDINENPFVALVVDHYVAQWEKLGWVQIRGQAHIIEPGNVQHNQGIERLQKKYRQYRDHNLEDRPLIRIRPGHAVSWGNIDNQLFDK